MAAGMRFLGFWATMLTKPYRRPYLRVAVRFSCSLQRDADRPKNSPSASLCSEECRVDPTLARGIWFQPMGTRFDVNSGKVDIGAGRPVNKKEHFKPEETVRFC